MEELLKSVYTTPPEDPVLKNAMAIFETVKWKEKDHLAGVMDADIDAICEKKKDTPVPVKTFMRAAARLANAAASARLAASSASGSASTPMQRSNSSVSQPQVQEIVGADWSAATIAKLLTMGVDEVDVAKQLNDANISKLPYHMQCERMVCKNLEAENKAATKEGRKAFAYVDLTAKEVLPLWLPQNTIGGNSMFGAEWSLSDGSASTLAELGKALQAATTQHKVFRSFPQWLGVFLK